MTERPIILVGYVPPALALLREFQPDGSIVLVEEPDIVRKRDVRAAAADSPLVGELVEWEYQLPGTADEFANARPDLASAAAVIPLVEYATSFAARLAERLGIPGASSGAAALLRDKPLLRRATRAAGIANPVCREVDSPGAVREFMAEHHGPVILKPTNRQAAVGIRVLHEPGEVDEAWAVCVVHDEGIFVPDRPMPLRMLVETYVHGHEYSVEMLVRDGEPLFANVTDKMLFPGPYPVERGHVVPAAIGPDLRALLAERTTDVLRATGFGTGVVHCEWIVRDDTPFLVECAGRLPGDGIAELLERAYGFSLGRAYFALMRGDDVPALPTEAARTAVVCFNDAVPGTITAITDLDQIRALPGVVSSSKGVSVGDTVRELHSSWDRLALVMTCAPTAHEAVLLAEKAIGQLQIDTVRSAT
ncbi:ATP-grasp domain-containing protein [Umezawaea sp. Da 62-37]|uniref:ATP-grasp domain-containing protein n=1 Tax=Umezawaea sp. Da 62-37 TaxID=3075927 RepID=UPI0028F6C2BC|nr:ATP-grasp domain-containing protein [Umezawaea sp. Da 62-37]WNV85221.1 ATP-grasp domain-containing protein [Umezawaea sp. Da 62-37]